MRPTNAALMDSITKAEAVLDDIKAAVDSELITDPVVRQSISMLTLAVRNVGRICSHLLTDRAE